MKTRTNFILFIALISIFLSQPRAFGQGVGDNAPDFTLSTLGGGQFSLSSHKGKVIFIFLFGYACPHCLANGNNTQTGIYDVFNGNSNFVAVGVDTWDGNESGVQNFINETGINYPVTLTGSALLTSYSTTYDRIIVVDQQGVIRYKATANATSSVVNEAKQVIDGLLNQTTAVSELQSNKKSIKVFPMPAKETLYIENINNFNKNINANIIDLNGKVIFSHTGIQPSDNNFSVPVNNLNPGVYILQIATGDEIYSEKIVISQ